MEKALEQARIAYSKDEVPVGAIITMENKIISKAYNLRELSQDSTCHAEVIAIRKACKALGTWRLKGCTLYVTLEPCPMCAGAIILSRLDKVVFGAFDPKGGACGSVIDLISDDRFNHQPEVISGVRAEKSAELLKKFFRQKR